MWIWSFSPYFTYNPTLLNKFTYFLHSSVVLMKCLEQTCITQINHICVGFKHQAPIIQRVLCLIHGEMCVFGFFCLWVEIFAPVKGIVLGMWKNTRPCMGFGTHFNCRSWVPVITYVERVHEGQHIYMVALDRQYKSNFVFLQDISIWIFSFTIIPKTLQPVTIIMEMDAV